MDSAAGQPVCRREGLAPPSPTTGRVCVCVCVCVWRGGPGLQVGLDFNVHVLTLRVFSIKSVAEYY